jgi:hypothetical protein
MLVPARRPRRTWSLLVAAVLEREYEITAVEFAVAVPVAGRRSRVVQGRVQLDVIFVLGRLKYVNEIAAVEFPIQIRVAKPDSYTQNATLDMLS